MEIYETYYLFKVCFKLQKEINTETRTNYTSDLLIFNDYISIIESKISPHKL